VRAYGYVGAYLCVRQANVCAACVHIYISPLYCKPFIHTHTHTHVNTLTAQHTHIHTRTHAHHLAHRFAEGGEPALDPNLLMPAPQFRRVSYFWGVYHVNAKNTLYAEVIAALLHTHTHTHTHAQTQTFFLSLALSHTHAHTHKPACAQLYARAHTHTHT